jgi:hypothetical protein
VFDQEVRVISVEWILDSSEDEQEKKIRQPRGHNVDACPTAAAVGLCDAAAVEEEEGAEEEGGDLEGVVLGPLGAGARTLPWVVWLVSRAKSDRRSQWMCGSVDQWISGCVDQWMCGSGQLKHGGATH